MVKSTLINDRNLQYHVDFESIDNCHKFIHVDTLQLNIEKRDAVTKSWDLVSILPVVIFLQVLCRQRLNCLITQKNNLVFGTSLKNQNSEYLKILALGNIKALMKEAKANKMSQIVSVKITNNSKLSTAIGSNAHRQPEVFRCNFPIKPALGYFSKISSYSKILCGDSSMLEH